MLKSNDTGTMCRCYEFIYFKNGFLLFTIPLCI